MGGFGSGRSAYRATIGGCGSYVLSISRLTRAGMTRGVWGKTSLRFGDGFEIDIGIDCRDEWGPFIELEHYPFRDDEEDSIRYRIRLIHTRPHLGGIRWWFECPRRYERCGKLYLPRGGRRFLSRQAYGLKYDSQNQTAFDRGVQKVRKIHRKLGGQGDGWTEDFFPDKPKWMRWKTYERLVDKSNQAQEDADQAWAVGAFRLIHRWTQ